MIAKKNMKGLRIYLDTNIVNYLYDFKGDYWKDWPPKIYTPKEEVTILLRQTADFRVIA